MSQRIITMENSFLSRYTLLLSVFFILQNHWSVAQDNLPTSFPDRIILNLPAEASTSMAVTWRTSPEMTESFCEIQPLTPTRIKQENSSAMRAKTTPVEYKYENEPSIEANQHSCILNNLKPGTNYLYRVGKKDHWSEWFEFKMPSNEDTPFSFVYFGDPQTSLKSEWSRVVRKAYNFVPDCSFMLYGGDIINRAGRDTEWDEWFKAGSYIFATVPQVLTPGNHDYDDLVIDSHWKYQFTQPQNGPEVVRGTCFYVDYKNLKIISVDSAVESELEDDEGLALHSQKVWLDSVLAANTKKWVILTTHLPFYSPKESRDNPQLRKHFQPVLEKYNVDLVLTGHDHSYGRGMASDFTENPSVMYVVSVSGPKLYEAGDKDWMQKSGSSLQFFHEVSVDGNTLRFKSFTADGKLFDQFVLKKRKNQANKLFDLNVN